LIPGSQGAHLRVVEYRTGTEAESVHTLESFAPRVPLGLHLEIVDKAALSRDGRTLYAWEAVSSSHGPKRWTEQFNILALDGDITTGVTQTLPAGTVTLAASPVRDEVYVLNRTLGTLTLLDPGGTRARVLAPVGQAPVALVVSADGSRAYVADQGSRSVTVVDLGGPPGGKRSGARGAAVPGVALGGGAAVGAPPWAKPGVPTAGRGRRAPRGRPARGGSAGRCR